MKHIYLLLLLLITPVSSVAVEKVVSLATVIGFPPYCFQKDGSQVVEVEEIPPGGDSVLLQGYSWDVVRESFHAMDYTIRLQVVPWRRAMHLVKMEKVDLVFPASRTVEREKYLRYSTEYVNRLKVVVFMLADSTTGWMQRLEYLKGSRVGQVRGWAYGKKWEADRWIKKIATDSIEQSVDMLLKKRVAGLVGYSLPYAVVLEEKGVVGQVKEVGSFDTVQESLIARKDDGASGNMLDDFDRGKKIIRGNGILESIEKKWL